MKRFIEKDLKSASISHRLYNYEGSPCRCQHGHSYKFKVIIESKKLNKQGMVIDFGKLAEVFNNFIQTYWDHSVLVWVKDKELLKSCKHLNDKYYMFQKQTTAENMSEFLAVNGLRWIRDTFREEYKYINSLTFKVWETDTSCSTTTVTKKDIK